MKKSFCFTAALLVMSLVWAGSAAWALNLRMNVQYTQQHPLCVKGFVPWADKVAEVTEGRVKVTTFYSNALFDPKQALDAIAARSADIGTVLPSYARNRMLLNSVMDLPMVAAEKAEVSSEVLWELFQAYPELQKELESIQVLWVYMNPPFQLHFTKKRVHNLADLKNAVVSAGGTTQSEILKHLGAAGEAMPMTDVYLALQKGVIEGCFLPYAPMRSQKIADLVKYHTNANLMSAAFFVGINKDAWKRISPKDQQAIEAISGRTASVAFGRIFDQSQVDDLAWMAAKGDEFLTLSNDEAALWAQKIAPIRDQWVQDAKAKGHANPEKILETALRLLEEKAK